MAERQSDERREQFGVSHRKHIKVPFAIFGGKVFEDAPIFLAACTAEDGEQIIPSSGLQAEFRIAFTVGR